jgi:hypothetical protein
VDNAERRVFVKPSQQSPEKRERGNDGSRFGSYAAGCVGLRRGGRWSQILPIMNGSDMPLCERDAVSNIHNGVCEHDKAP